MSTHRARSVPVERLLSTRSGAYGLDSDEVARRQAQYGPNQILQRMPRGWLDLLVETGKDPMLWFLLGTASLFGALGQWDESAILMVALAPLLGMDVYLHRRTHASLRGLDSKLASTASVERDGTVCTIDATELVPGDLVMLRAGDTIPADGLLLRTNAIQVDESLLTGEAMPVAKKNAGDAPENATSWIVEHDAWGFAGTRVLTGDAALRVVFVGVETFYGEIDASAALGSRARTPLQLAVEQLVRVLIFAAALICAMLAWVRYQQGHGVADALLSALTLAIAALPEEFPVVLTFFLGAGVFRLAKRQALVRRAVVVENIGRVSVICSDKTGTITEGRLRLSRIETADPLPTQRLLELASMASRRETGDPLDSAILDAHGSTPDWSVVRTFPFTEDRLRETGVVEAGGQLLAVTKGAPETILRLCRLEASQTRQWIDAVERLAQQGLKVIACAWQPLNAPHWPGGEPDQGFEFAGLLGFEDPVRPGVADALTTCTNAGIRVIMVTGDHPATAAAIATRIGLGSAHPRIADALQLERELERGDDTVINNVDVVCRAMPAQKLQLVQALQRRGEIVAVTGDGVNDVPALQAADVGIAMGMRGTRSAREVASIVLLDDDFASIVGAIAEGRQLFANLRLSFQYLLMIHLPLVITAALLPLLGYPVLYLPVHIVWLELIIHPTAMLVFQGLPTDGLQRRAHSQARPGRPRFFDPFQWTCILAVGGLVSSVVAFAFIRGLATLGDIEHARAIALAALTTSSAGITAGLTRLRGTAARVMVAGTLVLSFALIEVPQIAALLHLKPLDPDDLLIVLAGALVAAVIALLPSLRASQGTATES